MELRLCSITGGEWFDRLGDAPSAKLALPPRGFGVYFDRLLGTRVIRAYSCADLMQEPTVGTFVASTGVGFDPNLVHDALTASACTALTTGQGSSHHASTLETFLRSESPFDTVPQCFTEAGVTSCLRREPAVEIGHWLAELDRDALPLKIADMHSPREVAAQMRAIEYLTKLLTETVIDSEADLCVFCEPVRITIFDSFVDW